MTHPTARQKAHGRFERSNAGRPAWWRDAVVYQVYVRSFADSDGDGLGDLPGITSRLPYLRDLGVDALWITPFYPSPQHDAGYDVADYTDVDPLFGSLADADALLARAHDLGLQVIVDLVPNHTSSEHAWFQAALAAGPGSPERARYLFREGSRPRRRPAAQQLGVGLRRPGLDRASTDGQWYLHLFDSTQPDLDWRNPEVRRCSRTCCGSGSTAASTASGSTSRTACSRWRACATRCVAEGERPTSGAVDPDDARWSSATLRDEPMWDQPEVHDVYRRWRRSSRSTTATGWPSPRPGPRPRSRWPRYVRPDELHQAFNFAWLLRRWSAAAFAEVVAGTLAAVAPVGAAPTWVLSNHDVVRHPPGTAAARAAWPGPARRR